MPKLKGKLYQLIVVANIIIQCAGVYIDALLLWSDIRKKERKKMTLKRINGRSTQALSPTK